MHPLQDLFGQETSLNNQTWRMKTLMYRMLFDFSPDILPGKEETELIRIHGVF